MSGTTPGTGWGGTMEKQQIFFQIQICGVR
jgi:hypothetical protein